MPKNVPTILVIEDEKSLLKAWMEKFKSFGYKALGASEAVTALEIAFNCRPDLIVISLVMPSSEGLTIIKKLRENRWGSRVPVIFLNSWEDPEYLAQKQTPKDDYLAYNWSLEEVVEKVRNKLAVASMAMR